MSAPVSSLPGMSDILPEEATLWQWVEGRCREVLRNAGFGEIRTPILERTDLFVRTTGEGSEVVQKQMFTFDDRSGRSLSLRPEGTPSIMRAYLSSQGDGGPVRWYYMGPMFRSERPQAGRKRQFHQLGAEAIGSESVIVDAEMIGLTYDLCSSVGLPEAVVLVNSIGSAEDQAAIKVLLAGYFTDHREALCADCSRRLEDNVLRILDCKNEQCQAVIEGAPPISQAIGVEGRREFDRLLSLLDRAAIPFRMEPRLVRGLDYYTRTVWEVRHNALGAQDALGGGGRYDRLAESLGQKARRPGVGFAMGLERMLLAIQAGKGAQDLRAEGGPDVWLVSMGAPAEEANFLWAREVRSKLGLSVHGDFDGRSMKAQMRMANRSGARWVVICGEDELAKGVFCLKDLQSGEQWEVSGQDAVVQLGGTQE